MAIKRTIFSLHSNAKLSNFDHSSTLSPELFNFFNSLNKFTIDTTNVSIGLMPSSSSIIDISDVSELRTIEFSFFSFLSTKFDSSHVLNITSVSV